VSNAFASLLSLFNDVQGESEPILEYRSRFDGLTLKLSRCKVVLPHLLLVMLFLCVLHVCYADIVEQFRTRFKSIKTAMVDSIVSNVMFQDEFKLVDSKKGKPGVGASNPNQRIPAMATANTDRQGQIWQSPFEWLSKYGLKGIKGHWTRAMAGTGICPIFHCNKTILCPYSMSSLHRVEPQVDRAPTGPALSCPCRSSRHSSGNPIHGSNSWQTCRF
jgi:hypothetical protein